MSIWGQGVWMWVENSLVQMRSRLRGTIMITNNRNNNIWLSEIHHIICASDQISRVALLHLARRSPPSNAKLTRALSEWALLLWNREKIYGFCFTESLTARLLRWKIRKGMQTLVGPVGERYRDKESAEELTVSGLTWRTAIRWCSCRGWPWTTERAFRASA